MAGVAINKCLELSISVDLSQVPPELSADLGKLRRHLQDAIDTTQPQHLQLTVRPINAGANPKRVSARVKAEGLQDAMQSFGKWARTALRAALDKLQAEITPPPGPGLFPAAPRRRPLFGRIQRVENDEGEDELTKVELRGPSRQAIRRQMAAMPAHFLLAATTAPSIKDVAPTVAKPDPSGDPYHGCTPKAVEGDHELNRRKNRTDSAPWNLVSISSILDLEVPEHVSGPRDKWSPQQAKKVALFEGTPVKVEGWLADINKEGSEDCNCSSCDDVDYHLWVVDNTDNVNDKSQALVAEITPRISKDKANAIAKSVGAAKTAHGLRQIRISGWLLLDQKHVGETGRRTPWEIHPIIKFEIQDPQTGNWSTIFEPAP